MELETGLFALLALGIGLWGFWPDLTDLFRGDE